MLFGLCGRTGFYSKIRFHRSFESSSGMAATGCDIRGWQSHLQQFFPVVLNGLYISIHVSFVSFLVLILVPVLCSYRQLQRSGLRLCSRFFSFASRNSCSAFSNFFFHLRSSSSCAESNRGSAVPASFFNRHLSTKSSSKLRHSQFALYHGEL